MTLPKLQLFCSCNCPVAPTILALTPKKELLCQSACPNCGAMTSTVFPLQELLAHCPKPELTAEVVASAIDQAVEEATEVDSDGFTAKDHELMKGMHII